MLSIDVVEDAIVW